MLREGNRKVRRQNTTHRCGYKNTQISTPSYINFTNKRYIAKKFIPIKQGRHNMYTKQNIHTLCIILKPRNNINFIFGYKKQYLHLIYIHALHITYMLFIEL